MNQTAVKQREPKPRVDHVAMRRDYPMLEPIFQGLIRDIDTPLYADPQTFDKLTRWKYERVFNMGIHECPEPFEDILAEMSKVSPQYAWFLRRHPMMDSGVIYSEFYTDAQMDFIWLRGRRIDERIWYPYGLVYYELGRYADMECIGKMIEDVEPLQPLLISAFGDDDGLPPGLLPEMDSESAWINGLVICHYLEQPIDQVLLSMIHDATRQLDATRRLGGLDDAIPMLMHVLSALAALGRDRIVALLEEQAKTHPVRNLLMAEDDQDIVEHILATSLSNAVAVLKTSHALIAECLPVHGHA